MILANLSAFLNSLEHLLGFFVVLIALGFLWMLTAFIGSCFKRLTAKPQPTGNWLEEEAIEEEEVAAIAAVVMTMVGPKSRIVSIRSGAQDWNREGRREHFASHRIR